MKRRPETNAPREAGLTLIELLICVTIMGLLGFVVANTLVMALNFGPSSSQRSTFASNSGFLISNMSDDIANAVSVAPDVFTALGWSSPNCSLGFAGLKKFVFNAAGTDWAQYYAVLTASDRNDPAHLKVIVYRQYQKPNQALVTTDVLDGYCLKGATNQLVASYSDPTYKLDLYVSPGSGGSNRPLSLSADRRTLTPPP